MDHTGQRGQIEGKIVMRAMDVARLLSVGQPAVSRSAKRGQKIVQEMNLQPV
jgi:predicted transcriptional regulator